MNIFEPSLVRTYVRLPGPQVSPDQPHMSFSITFYSNENGIAIELHYGNALGFEERIAQEMAARALKLWKNVLASAIKEMTRKGGDSMATKKQLANQKRFAARFGKTAKKSKAKK